jgi:hypothetical protein
MSRSAALTGPAAMPFHQSTRTPYFSGNVEDSLEDFLRDFEELANSCQLTGPQKVEKILRYIPSSQRNHWKSFDGYDTRDWDEFRRSLEEIYDPVSTASLYSQQKLYDFVKYSARTRATGQSDVIQYYRRFMMLSKPLITSDRLTREERNRAFWLGFHPEDRNEMHPRLIAQHPRQPTGKPFNIQDVYSTARAVFTGNQFFPLEFQEQWDDEPRGRGDRSERAFERWFEERDPWESDRGQRAMPVEREREPPLRETLPRESSRRREQEAYRPSAPNVETKVVKFKEPADRDQEIEDLVGRMHDLDIRERSYAILYAQCADRFPNIAQVMPKPELSRTAPSTSNAFTYQAPSTFPQPSVMPQQPQAFPLQHTPPLQHAPSHIPVADSTPLFRSRPRIEGCAFCTQLGHRVRECPAAREYVNTRRAMLKNDRLYLPDGTPIPNDGTGRGLKGSIDSWLAAHYTAPSTTTFARDPPPHTALSLGHPPGRIEEVVETNILQILAAPTPNPDEEPEDEQQLDIFGVFAGEKKKRETRASRLPELATPDKATIPTPAPPTASTTRPGPQYRYQATAEDSHLVSELQRWLLDGRLSQTTPAHVLAASPTIRKELVDKLRVRRVEANAFEEVQGESRLPESNPAAILRLSALQDPDYSSSLEEIDVLVNEQATERGIIDTGSQIVAIREDLAREVGAHINTERRIEMEGANGATNWTVGCVEFLSLQVQDVPFKIHAHVVKHAPFRLLLGRPFQRAVLCRIEDLPNGKLEISIGDPSNPAHRIAVPSQPRKARAASVKVISLTGSTLIPCFDTIPTLEDESPYESPFLQPPIPLISSLAYKKVANKVRPVPASLPEDFRTIRRIPVDPLLSLPPLTPNPPAFTPGTRLTQERLDALNLNRYEFLWPEEIKLLQHVLKISELGLAWTEDEKGRFRDDYFSPVKIPVIEHVPWAHKNIPIPTGILDEVIQILKDKFAAGVYEHSDSSYRSRWFCVKKKSGALRLVHDLQPLNAITVRNSGIPPPADQIIESMAGRACYTMLDLFVGYDHRTLDIASRDLTTIQSPIGAIRLTCLPQGWTNAGAIFHEDVTFILEPEIPHVAWPYMDDCSIKGPATRYETEDGGYKTIPENPGIRKFVWEHLTDVHRILHRLRCAGATVSAKKLFIAAPEVIILGHKCNYNGRIPDDSKIARIRDWPPCKNITDVRAFLGITGYMRIWIKNYSAIARPLVNLTRKDETFSWQQQHEDAMQALKQAIIDSPALISIDYTSDRAVYLAVDSSIRGVGWILSQNCEDGKRRPARFGSISWNERESRYSQAKIELYGLFRALRALRLHLVGIRDLIVEMDAQFIRGMLKNPDIQPNATINRWIAAIQLFDFKLVHVPADKHQGPDGLSRRGPAEGEDEEDDPEEWIDNALSLGLWTNTWLGTQTPRPGSTSVWTINTSSTPPDDATRFPINDKARKANDEVQQIHQYLRTHQLPSGLKGKDAARFLAKIKRFCLLDGRLWRQQDHGRHQLYVDTSQRHDIVRDAHDKLGHKGFYSTRRTLLDRFWWPSLEQDVKWYVDTCHQCQLRQTTKIRLPPIVAVPAPLFRKAYVDTMFMPFVGGFRYIAQARCSLTAWPEWRALRTETGRTLGAFLFEEVLCRWGAVEEIVTDNGTAYVAALDWLSNKYGIRHIRISAYNSQANGIVERQHRTIRESIVKACEGDASRWPVVAPLAFWADRVTTRKSTGHSPFYMAHGVEPILPFDITLATFLVPDLTKPLSTAELLATRTRQLEKRSDDLALIHQQILKSRFASASQFERRFEETIQDHNFKPGDLVLVRNSSNESDLGRKTKPRYCGPMVVVRRTRNGAYRLAELDGAVSKLRYAAFRLVPYFSRSRTSIPVTRILDREDLVSVIEEDAAADASIDYDDA